MCLCGQFRQVGSFRSSLQPAMTFPAPFITRPDTGKAGSFDPRYLKRFTAHDGPNILTMPIIVIIGGRS